MKEHFHIKIDEWLAFLSRSSEDYLTYAPIKESGSIDYQVIHTSNCEKIIFNTPKPVTPLKLFFLPVRENVGREENRRKTVIAGVPSCDLEALDILDEFYLNEKYPDPYYRERRENTVLIGSACQSIQEHCHCTSYGIDPHPVRNCDLSLDRVEDDLYIEVFTDKGRSFLGPLEDHMLPIGKVPHTVTEIRDKVRSRMREKNSQLPDYPTTEKLIRESGKEIWEKYSQDCVSCGSCATICPTCTCFLLIDRPGFEKIRQMDACQYPGFARIAAGEDHLGALSERFRNRYMCKYVWKPSKFESQACTGCGRCIDSCIGRINKNELFMELEEQDH